ncbi:hypothetical protein ACHWQZ_G012127 [Mnemiopsis leidyi]
MSHKNKRNHSSTTKQAIYPIPPSSPTTPNQRESSYSTFSSAKSVPPPIPPKRFRYKVSGSTSSVTEPQRSSSSSRSPVVGPPLPDKRAKTPKSDDNGPGRGDIIFTTVEGNRLSGTNNVGLVSRELERKITTSKVVPRKMVKHDSLEKFRENSSVKQRIKDLALDHDHDPVSIRNQPLSHQEKETKSLNRRAKLSIKIDDNEEEEIGSFYFSPILSPPSASKFIQKRKSGKHRSSSKRRSIKSPAEGDLHNSIINPAKPVKPSKHFLTAIFRDNYYRFSGFLFERTIIGDMKRTNSQPKLYSIFAFDLECGTGVKRWHSEECLRLRFCPKIQFKAFKNDFHQVKRRNPYKGRLKKLVRSQKAFTIHEDELSSYLQLDSSDFTTYIDPLSSHVSHRLGEANETSKPKRSFSKSVTNLLSPGPSRKTSRKTSCSSQEYDKTSGSSKRDRFGSLSSSSFANLMNFLTSKNK